MSLNDNSPIVSIITKNNIRYEGEFYALNKKEKLILLKNHICMGSENSKKSYIIFKKRSKASQRVIFIQVIQFQCNFIHSMI